MERKQSLIVIPSAGQLNRLALSALSESCLAGGENERSSNHQPR
jgi:hypothetical protein